MIELGPQTKRTIKEGSHLGWPDSFQLLFPTVCSWKTRRGFRLNISKGSLGLRAGDWEVGGLEFVPADNLILFFCYGARFEWESMVAQQ